VGLGASNLGASVMDKKESGSNFYQLTAQVLNDSNLSPSEKICMSILYGLSDEEGKCFPSNGWLAKKLSMSERGVQKVLEKLEKNNYIFRQIVTAENNRMKKYRIIYVTNNFKFNLDNTKKINRDEQEFVCEDEQEFATETNSSSCIIDKKNIIDKKEKKAASPPKKAPLARPITLNPKNQQWEGISEDDINNWQDAFPAVNIRKELGEARIWALNAHRSNYRRSLNSWMSNKNKEHTTPPRPKSEDSIPASREDVEKNRKISIQMEQEYSKNRNNHYDIQAQETKILFILPEGKTFSVEYDLPCDEFLKRCLPAIKAMRLEKIIHRSKTYL
jgi:DNA-binding MarR family transcriptional regulator